MKPRVAALAALNREIGIRGGYQNHVGTRVGGSVWDLGVLLEGIAPDGLGVQYDIRHAVAEGGESWPVALRMIAPHIDTIAVKDFVWAQRPDGRWAAASVPLGEGMVNFPAYLRQLLARGPLPPATMHFEYPPLEMAGGGGAERRKQTVDGMRRDLTRFQQLLAAAQSSTGAGEGGVMMPRAPRELSRREFLAVAGAAAALPLVDRIASDRARSRSASASGASGSTSSASR